MREMVLDLLDEDIPKLSAKAKRRRARCRESLYDFCVEYCCGDGGFLVTPPEAPKLREIVTLAQEAVRTETAKYLHARIARGHGKTSIMKCAIAYALCYGFRRYIVAAAAKSGLAGAIIEDIWNLFDRSPTLMEDFPEICVPIHKLQGKYQRVKSITFKGEPTDMRKSNAEMRLPTMRGFPNTGGILAAVGFSGAARGMVHGSLRPDLVLFDDLQTDEMAASAEQVRKAAEKIEKQFMGLSGHTKRIAALMTSTPIQPDDLSDLYARSPSWTTSTFPMVLHFPKCFKAERGDLWEEYRDIRYRELHADGKMDGEANRFYKLHRAEMDDGAEVLNPINYDRDLEVSAIQHAMNLLFDRGEEAFDAEYQMSPHRATAVYDLTAKLVASRVNGVPHMQVPAECSRLVATVDVMKNAGLRWVIVGFGGDRVAAVVAYGRYPAVAGKPLYTPTATQEEQISAVAAALGTLCDQFATSEFTRKGGGDPMKIDAVGIDAGWMSRMVSTFCRSREWQFKRINAMRGISYARWKTHTLTGKLAAGVREADEWVELMRSQYGEYIGFHSDHWREESQRAWFAEPLQPGSLSLYGRDPSEHSVFADEAVADRLVDKDTSRSGEQMWQWAVNSANHLGDCVTMAYALANWHRVFKTFTRVERTAPAQTPTAPTAQRPKSNRYAPLIF